jgi:hypothetical protein
MITRKELHQIEMELVNLCEDNEVMKETIINKSIKDLLTYYENLGIIVFQRNNTGAYKTNKGGFIRYGRAGSPDFYVFCKDGKTLMLEVKNEKGRINENQKQFQNKIAD